jgi:hypothetical protein
VGDEAFLKTILSSKKFASEAAAEYKELESFTEDSALAILSLPSVRLIILDRIKL